MDGIGGFRSTGKRQADYFEHVRRSPKRHFNRPFTQARHERFTMIEIAIVTRCRPFM
jgi:hypothetical protein